MELAQGRGAAGKMPSLKTLVAGVAGAAIPAGVVFAGHLAVILAASLAGLLALLIVVLALVGVFAPDVTTKTDAVRVLRILLNRETREREAVENTPGLLRIDRSRHRSLPHLATAEFRRVHLTEKPAGNCFAPGSYPEAGDRQRSWGSPVPPCSSPPVPWPRRRSSLIVFDSICRMLSRVTP
jgi:hypothetical protein